MDIRLQIAMVFHLDKCIGCHTCSIACKNVWTDRKGAEYMWWNNVETKPGTGYPTKWEEQEIYQGGWVKKDNSIELKHGGKLTEMKNIFHNKNLPVLDDYYEPWTYKYSNLFEAPEGDDQPVAHTISLVTGKPIDVKAGPNWDDDLGGSIDYARQDSNIKNLSEADKKIMFQLEKMAMFYLPRMCNHCLNPSCVAACPSGAAYKRGEEGIVVIDQNKCRGWRMCVSSCPYKKSYYNWSTGKSEKCILCYPRLETGQVPACMHSCVGRIRYLGGMLYDADKIKEVASCDESDLVNKHVDIYLDPFDKDVIAAAKKNGIADSTIDAAQRSPVYKYIKEWKVALPLHPEFRTLPNLFYVPPLLPIMGAVNNTVYDSTAETLFGEVDDARMPLKYLASLFTAGDTAKIREVLNKLMAVRMHRRDVTVGDQDKKQVQQMLKKAGLDAETADAIFRLTSLPKVEDRFVIPDLHREEAIEMIENTGDAKGSTGFGFVSKS